jgi:Zn-dependent protease with chaperone function
VSCNALHARSDSPAARDGHHLVWGLQLAFGLVGLIGTASAVATAAASVHRDTAQAKEVVILGGHFTYPAVNVAAVALLLLALVGLLVVTRVAAALWRQSRGYHQLLQDVRITGALAGHPGVTVIDDPVPQAFCAGYLRPRVYVSRATLELLAADELDAVLSHEEQHRRARDPLRLAFAGALSEALFFLPALAPLRERYSELSELRADRAAVAAAGGERHALASALLAFDAQAPEGATGISPERVDSLLGVASRWRLPATLIALSAAASTLLIVLVWRASVVASAHTSFNLPLLSAQPCMLVLALVPILAWLGQRQIVRH